MLLIVSSQSPANIICLRQWLSNSVFLDMQASNGKLELQRLLEARCGGVASTRLAIAVQQTLPATLSTLEHFSLDDNSNAERSLQATSLLHFINGQLAVREASIKD